MFVKRENYSSEEEYQRAKEQMVKEIEIHNKLHPEIRYNPNAREEFIKAISHEKMVGNNINYTSNDINDSSYSSERTSDRSFLEKWNFYC